MSIDRMKVVDRQSMEPNFRDKNGKLFLVRCYACGGERGTENYGPTVATGQCAWCGWNEEIAPKEDLVGGTPDYGKRGDHGRDTTY